MEKVKIGVISLGCPKNLVDTRNILRQLPKKLFLVTNDTSNSDIVLLNTCTFIDDAKKENLGILTKLIADKKKNTGTKILVTGCLVERYYARLRSYFPEVDAFFRLKDQHKIAEYLTKMAGDHSGYKRLYRNLDVTPPHYTYIKIAEGCDEKCSFCIIPKIRGKFKSRPIPEIKNELREEIKKGVTEIMLVAQDLLYYGMDTKPDIYELLDELTGLHGDFQIRLLYLNINLIDTGFVEYVLKNPKIMNYFDIPLQHIDSRILRMMNKPADVSERFIKLKNLIESKNIPHILRTSFIFGFPTETAKEFKMILNFLEKENIANVGFFKYSSEEGTESHEKFEDNVSERIKNMRVKKAYKTQNEIMARNSAKFVGKRFDCIIDAPLENNMYKGRIIFYDYKKNYLERPVFNAPDIDYDIIIRSKKKLSYGYRTAVIIKKINEDNIFGETL